MSFFSYYCLSIFILHVPDTRMTSWYNWRNKKKTNRILKWLGRTRSYLRFTFCLMLYFILNIKDTCKLDCLKNIMFYSTFYIGSFWVSATFYLKALKYVLFSSMRQRFLSFLVKLQMISVNVAKKLILTSISNSLTVSFARF